MDKNQEINENILKLSKYQMKLSNGSNIDHQYIYKQKITDYTNKLKNLGYQFGGSKDEDDAIEVLNTEITNKINNITTSQAEADRTLTALSTKADNLKVRFEHFTNEMAAHITGNAAQEEKIAALEAEKKTLSNEKENLEAQLTASENKLHESDNDHQHYVATATRVVGNLNAQLQTLVGKNTELTNKVTAFQQRLEAIGNP